MFYIIGNYWRKFIHKTYRNHNHVHKKINIFLSVITILGTDVHGDETICFSRMNMNNIGKIEHVLKHSHERCVVAAFDKFLHEGYPWNGT